MGMVIGSLVFWKPRPGSRKTGRQLDQALQSGKEPPELQPLPVKGIVTALRRQYPEMEWSDGFAEVDLDDVQAGIELSWKPDHFRFDFYGNGFPQTDVVARLFATFGCSCYFVGEKDDFPPDKLPKFHDPGADADLDAKLEAMKAHAMAAGPDPQQRLKAALEFMNLPGSQNESAAPKREKPVDKSPAGTAEKKKKKKNTKKR